MIKLFACDHTFVSPDDVYVWIFQGMHFSLATASLFPTFLVIQISDLKGMGRRRVEYSFSKLAISPLLIADYSFLAFLWNKKVTKVQLDKK